MRKLWGSCCSIKVLTVMTAASFVLLAGMLCISFILVPYVIDISIDKSVRLKPDTDQWDRFVDLPIPIITRVYLYNITNADQVLLGDIPILQEVGPYVYKQHIKKDILDIDISNDAVSYEKLTTTEFDQELSGDYTENDTVVVLNPVLLVLSQITSTIEQLAIQGCLDKLFPEKYNQLFIQANVGTLMFDGFVFANLTDDLGIACSLIRTQVIEKTKIMKNVYFVYNDDNMVQYLTFSYIGFKIQAPDGNYTVNRGIDDISQLGHIMKWNDADETPYYGRLQSINNDTCKKVRGGDSTIYPPRVTKSSTFEIFSTDICRTVKLFYTGEKTYKGIKGYQFEPSSTTFYQSTEDVEHDCYCTKRTLNPRGQQDCFLDGALDVYDCFGVPLLLTFPHFLHADQKYLDGVKNLSAPDQAAHGIYLLIEPNTGTPLQGRKRVQLNMVLRPIKYLPFAATLPETVLPLLWVEESADLTDDLIDMINSQYFNAVKLANGVKYGLIAVSAAVCLVVGGILFRKTVLKWCYDINRIFC